MALLGLGLSACGLAYVFRDILFGDAQLASRLAEILESFRTRTRIGPLLASVAIYWLLVILLRSLLVKHLLSKVSPLKVSKTYRHICIGFLANNVLPFRAGEMARSAAISKGSGVSFASVVGGLAVERMLDMTMLVLIALGALQVAPLPSSVRNGAIILGGILVVGFAVMILLSRRKREIAPPDPSRKIRSFVWNQWVRFSRGFSAMGSARGILMAVALAFLLWALALVVITMRLWAFDLPVSLGSGLVLLTSVGFGVAVPSAPGYLGVYHAAVAFALELMGVETGVAVAFGWFSWFIDVGISSVTGAVSLSVEGLKLGELKGSKGDGDAAMSDQGSTSAS